MRGLFKPGMPGGAVRLPFPVWFARHGETDWNRARRFQGHADIPLNDTGRAQAARNGFALRADIAAPDRLHYVASPLSRCRETMEIIRSGLRLPAQRYAIDDRLIEIDLGDWNGKSQDEIEIETPGAFAAREADKWNYVVPGGESYAAAAARVREFLLTLDRSTLVIGHGATGRLLRAYLTGRKRDAVAHLKAPQHVAHRLARGRETEI